MNSRKIAQLCKTENNKNNRFEYSKLPNVLKNSEFHQSSDKDGLNNPVTVEKTAGKAGTVTFKLNRSRCPQTLTSLIRFQSEN